MTILGPSLRFMITQDAYCILKFGDHGEFLGGIDYFTRSFWHRRDLIWTAKKLHEQKQPYSYAIQIDQSKEHCGNSHEELRWALSWEPVSIEFNRCTGKSSLRLIRGRGMFEDSFIQSTRVNLVFCAVCLTFVIAAFMAEVPIFSSPRIIKKIGIHAQTFHGVHAFPNFLQWNQFRSNLGIICGSVQKPWQTCQKKGKVKRHLDKKRK